MAQLRASIFDTVAFDARLTEDRLIEMGVPALRARQIRLEMQAAHKRERLLADLRKGKAVRVSHDR